MLCRDPLLPSPWQQVHHLAGGVERDARPDVPALPSFVPRDRSEGTPLPLHPQE